MEKQRVGFDTFCQNQKGEVVIAGEAMTLVPKEALTGFTKKKDE